MNLYFKKKRYLPKNQILILHSNWSGVNGLIKSINNRLGIGNACDPHDLDPGVFIRVTTLNAGTGLESPIVFIVGLKQLFEEEQSLNIFSQKHPFPIFTMITLSCLPLLE